MMKVTELQQYAPLLTRIAVSLVFLWFGINQLLNPDMFLGYLPEFLVLKSYAPNLILFNGIFETMLGLSLIAGFLVRPVALILALHLFGIAFSLGYNDVAVRDFGLAIVTFAVFLNGPDKFCLDNRIRKKEEK